MAKKENAVYNEMQKINKTALTGYITIGIILVLAYIMELVKGNRTPGYIAVFMLLLLIPLAASVVIYKSKNDSVKFRYILAASYLIICTFVLLTGVSKLTALYVLPMMILLTLYRDSRLIWTFGGITLAANVIFLIYFLSNISNTATDITEFEIVIAVIILLTVFCDMAVRVLAESTNHRIADIESKEKAQEQLLAVVLDSTKKICDSVEAISTEAHNVNNQVAETQVSLDEIVRGTNETTGNVQNQMEKTANISNLLGEMSTLSQSLVEECGNSDARIRDGKKSMDTLLESSKELGDSNSQVVAAMKSLEEKAASVNEVIAYISSIAHKTNLLSLNASIEAARAGEAGRGFSVVAEQIRQLSEQTREATDRISEIISALVNETEATAVSVNSMSEISDKQIVFISEVNENFANLQESVIKLNNSVSEQSRAQVSIEHANRDVMESISHLSAFSEELSATTDNTSSQSELSRESVENITRLLENVMKDIDELKGITENSRQ